MRRLLFGLVLALAASSAALAQDKSIQLNQSNLGPIGYTSSTGTITLPGPLVASGSGGVKFSGTSTSDNAVAGNVGEILSTGLCPGTSATATVTITIAAPGVVTWTAHGITGACPVVFTTSSALPTGITASTVYYVVPSSVTANTFQIATTVANALAGTAITTTGSQSGTQTGTAGLVQASTTAADLTGLALTAGDWDCRANVSRVLGASTSVTKLIASLSTTSATQAAQGSMASATLQTAANVMGALGQDQKIGPFRVSLATTTNYFLPVTDTFSVSTDAAFGWFECRRVR